MKYAIDGHLDLAGIVVHDYEIDYALSTASHRAYPNSRENVRRNIAIGKLCGAYDPWPAMRWQALREVQRPVLIGVVV